MLTWAMVYLVMKNKFDNCASGFLIFAMILDAIILYELAGGLKI